MTDVAPACTCHGLRPAEQASPPPSSRSHLAHDSNPDHLGHGSPAGAVLRLAAELLASAPDRFSFSATAGGYVVTVVPAAGLQATPTAAPPASAAAVTNAAGPVACSKPAAGEPLPDLTRHFLSTHERLMLLELAAHPGCRAAEVREACRVEVEASRFWSLWANLQHRGLVVDGRKGGFAIAGKWVSELLART